MGFPASPRLREDLVQSRLHAEPMRGRAAMWAVVRSDAEALPLELAKVLSLPASAPNFNIGAAMDATFFLTPPMRDVVGELGLAMRRETFA